MRSQDEIKKLLVTMSIEEKASLLSGRDAWRLQDLPHYQIEPIMLTDGPHGVRKQPEDVDQLGIGSAYPATCFPTAVTLASSWDVNLLKQVGEALGDECRAEEVSVLLGPGLNIKRSPLCGRNFEYFSEDPYLSGHLAAALVNGVQSKGVGTCMKHFAVNNQEYFRFVVDTVVDERTLREIYLTGFEITVKESQPWSAMCAYNQLNEKHLSDNKKLLTDILRDEWGFQGLVMSDWGATNDRVAGVKAGLDIEMPGSGGLNDEKIVAAVNEGVLSEAELDRVALRVITLIEKALETKKGNYSVDKDKHHIIAQTAAEQSMVLLKNEANTLPLKKENRIAVIGDMAKEVRIQGTGSSQINPTQTDIHYTSLCDYTGETLPFAKGYHSVKDLPDQQLIDEAVQIAKNAEVVILFIGLTKIFESEGFDRDHLSIPNNQIALIEALATTGTKIVSVLTNGSPVEMPWLNKVDALLEAYLCGQAGGPAVTRLLYGKVNPSGKLAETFPLALNDSACSNYFPGTPAQVEYREGLYVGYRYFDSVNKDVLFPFGFGLSYTNFTYSDIKLSAHTIAEDDQLKVSCTITNSGKYDGSEIVQIYVHDKESTIYRPEKELKGFVKVFLKAGEKQQVEYTLDKRSFAFYDVETKAWQIEAGEYDILIGSSSAQIHLSKVVTVNSAFIPVVPQAKRAALEEYYSPAKNGLVISDSAFTELLGRVIPTPVSSKPYHQNSTPFDLQKSFLGRRVAKRMRKESEKQLSGSGDDEAVKMMMRRMLDEMPLRSGVLFSAGKGLNFELLDATLNLLNGKLFKALSSFKKGKAKLRKDMRR